MEFMVVKSVELLPLHELGLGQRVAVVFAQLVLDLGDELHHIGVGPAVADLDVEEGLVSAREDARGLAVGVDAEHLDDELLVVLARHELGAAVQLVLDIKLE